MRRLIILFLLCISPAIFAGNNIFNENFTQPDTVKLPYLQAAYKSQIPNAFIFFFNRVISKNEFAYINAHTIKSNFKHRPMWDYDLFGTNLMAHPFHGSLDYVGARINGLNYYECLPYVFMSSLIWEYILENEPPAINDQIATFFGGAIWGEISYRLSMSVLNSQTVGFERVCREFFGALCSPMNAINRIISGQMWKRAPAPKYYKKIPVTADVQMGLRLLSDKYSTEFSGYIDLKYKYGNPYKESKLPFENFRVHAVADPLSKKSFLTKLSATGSIFNKTTDYHNSVFSYGIYQHYVFLDAISNKKYTNYFQYTEPACVGGGFLTLTENKTNTLKTENYLSAIFLAASHASEFLLKGRDYNYGIGYTFNHITDFDIKNKCNLMLDFKYSQIFTPKGYHKGTDLSRQSYLDFYSMGDQGNTQVIMLSSQINIPIKLNFSANINYNFFYQFTNNYKFPNYKVKTQDVYLGIKYSF